MDEIWLVMTNAPDRKTARKIAALLVDRKLAACVNIVGACEAVYRWEGKVEIARGATTDQDDGSTLCRGRGNHPGVASVSGTGGCRLATGRRIADIPRLDSCRNSSNSDRLIPC